MMRMIMMIVMMVVIRIAVMVVQYNTIQCSAVWCNGLSTVAPDICHKDQITYLTFSVSTSAVRTNITCCLAHVENAPKGICSLRGRPWMQNSVTECYGIIVLERVDEVLRRME